MEVQQKEKKERKKIPMPHTFNMLYEVLRSGNKISTPKNEGGGGTRRLRKQIF
jgi:hypothetical protein